MWHNTSLIPDQNDKPQHRVHTTTSETFTSLTLDGARNVTLITSDPTYLTALADEALRCLLALPDVTISDEDKDTLSRISLSALALMSDTSVLGDK